MSNKKSETRDNMLVTTGARAGYMDSMNCISVGGNVYDEEILAKFAVGVMDEYLATDNDTPFDEFIENDLIERYGKANVCYHGIGRNRG